MSTIGYGYGSEWHLLRYLGYHRRALDAQVRAATGASAVVWLDSPFSAVRASLRDDQEWLRLDFLGSSEQEVRAKQAWRTFWPTSGQPHHWDAVGQLVVEGQQEWVLVEAKAHKAELLSTCGAISPRSRQTIEVALQQTQTSCGATSAPINQWLTPYYQYANRLAAMDFLNRHAIPARILNIYFCGESHSGWDCPKDSSGWDVSLQGLKTHLGINANFPLLQRVHSVFLPVQM